MPIIIDQFNTLYIGGRKGKKYEIRFRPSDCEMPWSVVSRGQGKYFETLREALAFCAGRSWIGVYEIKDYQNEIMQTLDRKWEE